jgi:hypothetical protein
LIYTVKIILMNCRYCNDEKNIYGLKNHERYCKLNPDRKDYDSSRNPMKGRKGSNQYIKAKKEGREKPLRSEESYKKQALSMSLVKWSDSRRKKHSDRMKEAVKSNPSSYSSSNVSGRTKTIEYNGFKLKGTWEYEVAKYLDENYIKWTNIIETPFEYEWEGEIHLYFPDFYLTDYDLYLEVKGYERDRDREKWKVLDNLIIIKKKEIEEIKKRLYRLSLITS